MKLSAILAPLIKAKVPHELIMEQVLAYEAEQADALERRREHERERQAKHRLSRDSRDPSTVSRDRSLVREGVTRVEEKPLPQKIEPQKKVSSAARLAEEWTLPSGWGRDAIEAGLPADLIDIEAAKMRDWSLSAPKGAKTDWRAAWRNWCREAAGRLQPRAGPPPKPTLANGFDRLADEMRRQNELRSGGSGGSVHQAIPHLSAVRGG